MMCFFITTTSFEFFVFFDLKKIFAWGKKLFSVINSSHSIKWCEKRQKKVYSNFALPAPYYFIKNILIIQLWNSHIQRFTTTSSACRFNSLDPRLTSIWASSITSFWILFWKLLPNKQASTKKLYTIVIDHHSVKRPGFPFLCWDFLRWTARRNLQ
jgi:hypothetical protein